MLPVPLRRGFVENDRSPGQTRQVWETPENDRSPASKCFAAIPRLALALILFLWADCISLSRLFEARMVSSDDHVLSMVASVGGDSNMTLSNTSERCLPSLHRQVPVTGSQCSNSSHYCYDENGVVHWYPLKSCELPPPQAFWMLAVGATSKGVGMAILFPIRFEGEVNRCKDVALAAFIVGQALISIILLVLKAWSMSGFESWFEHSQCWGMILSTAPFSQNLLLYCIKMAQSCTALVETREDSRECSAVVKAAAYFLISWLSLTVLVLVNGPFLVTNLIPMFFGLIWVALAILCLGCVPAGVLFVWFSRELLEPVSEAALPLPDVRPRERKLNWMVVAFIPIALIFDTYVQWLAAASVYFYHGAGYFCSAWIAVSERRSDIYMINFEQQILRKAPWLAELINQVLP